MSGKGTAGSGIPVVAFAGYSGSGKTTVIQTLIPYFRRRGFRVAVVKHDAHHFDMDRPGKDSWQFTQAGADVTAISSPEKTALLEQRELTLEEVLNRVKEVDLILVEGYKNAPLPQIGICRAATGQGFTAPPENFVAVVTDLDNFAAQVPAFPFQNMENLAEFITNHITEFARLINGALECPAQKDQEGIEMLYTAAVLTVSDKGARGERLDTSGPALVRMLEESGYQVVHTAILPDEQEMIRQELIRCADEKHLALVLTTGGTGFSPRDVTPEATKSILERETPGIPEAMRAESMRITPRGCLSRETAGIRGNTLIVNLPGSEKAARENLQAVLEAIAHGLDMLHSHGSADCGAVAGGEKSPSVDDWLREAKALQSAGKIGMYLLHNGVVRETPRIQVREGHQAAKPVSGMYFDYDAEKVREALEETRRLPGIYYVRVWLNRGELKVGDDLMLVLVGGDIRPRVIAALETLVENLKSRCVVEREL